MSTAPTLQAIADAGPGYTGCASLWREDGAWYFQVPESDTPADAARPTGRCAHERRPNPPGKHRRGITAR